MLLVLCALGIRSPGISGENFAENDVQAVALGVFTLLLFSDKLTIGPTY